MSEGEKPPSEFNAQVPNMARMYDYALGGKDNYAADREAVGRLFKLSPENKHVPTANRRFLGRAVRFAADQGITQFLDLGAGLPSQGNVHEVARDITPDAHVVYVDNDPVVAMHAKVLLAGAESGVAAVQADIRDHSKILAHPEVERLIDFSQPVAILFVSVLHGIPDSDDPADIVRGFTSLMAPGSYLILSHLTRDGHPPDIVRKKEEVFARSNTPFVYRSRAEILGYFDGFDLIEPGLVPVTEWQGDSIDQHLRAAGEWWLGGVGRGPAKGA